MPEWLLAWLIILGVFVGLPYTMYLVLRFGHVVDKPVCEVALARRLTDGEYEEICRSTT